MIVPPLCRSTTNGPFSSATAAPCKLWSVALSLGFDQSVILSTMTMYASISNCHPSYMYVSAVKLSGGKGYPLMAFDSPEMVT